MNKTEINQAEWKECAGKLAAALNGCVVRLRIAIADEGGEASEELNDIAPSRLDNIKNVSAALSEYEGLTIKSDGRQPSESKRVGISSNGLLEIISEIEGLVDWHADKNADIENESPTDMHAHCNGLVLQAAKRMRYILSNKPK